MSKQPATELAEFLYLALAEPIGLLLACDDPERARAKLYAARREIGDPELDRLQVRLSPLLGGNLVICRGRARESGTVRSQTSE